MGNSIVDQNGPIEVRERRLSISLVVVNLLSLSLLLIPLLSFVRKMRDCRDIFSFFQGGFRSGGR